MNWKWRTVPLIRQSLWLLVIRLDRQGCFSNLTDRHINNYRKHSHKYYVWCMEQVSRNKWKYNIGTLGGGDKSILTAQTAAPLHNYLFLRICLYSGIWDNSKIVIKLFICAFFQIFTSNYYLKCKFKRTDRTHLELSGTVTPICRLFAVAFC